MRNFFKGFGEIELICPPLIFWTLPSSSSLVFRGDLSRRISFQQKHAESKIKVNFALDAHLFCLLLCLLQ